MAPVTRYFTGITFSSRFVWPTRLFHHTRCSWCSILLAEVKFGGSWQLTFLQVLSQWIFSSQWWWTIGRSITSRVISRTKRLTLRPFSYSTLRHRCSSAGLQMSIWWCKVATFFHWCTCGRSLYRTSQCRFGVSPLSQVICHGCSLHSTPWPAGVHSLTSLALLRVTLISIYAWYCHNRTDMT